MSAAQTSVLETAAATEPRPDRAAINRENARHSTGPRTPDGKQRSSLNALRHGLTSRNALLPSEDPAAYQAHMQRYIDELQPHGALEEQLVQSLASAAWRLNRIPALEASLLAAAETEGFAGQARSLSTLSMNEQRLSRQFDRTLKQLRELQAERRAAEQLQQDNEQPGFVFPENPVDAWLVRHVSQERAQRGVVYDDSRQHPERRAECAKPATPRSSR
jgi:hypothetical protein